MIVTHDDLFSPSKVSALLKYEGIQLKKSLGQNFLIDRNVALKTVDACALQPDDVIFEIGAGLGTLTVLLSSRSKRVISYEIDKRLVTTLTCITKAHLNIEIRNEDIKNALKEAIFPERYILVSNVPYYMASYLVRLCMSHECKPKRMILIIQKEMGKRITASPPEMSLLSVGVQLYATPRIVSVISRNCFFPRPNVDSVLIVVELKKTLPLDTRYEKEFFDFVRAGFSSKRKILIGNLMNHTHRTRGVLEELFLRVGLKITARAEELSLEDWVKLFTLNREMK